MSFVKFSQTVRDACTKITNENLDVDRRRGDSHIKKTAVHVRRTFQGLKKTVLVPVKVFILKRPSWVLSQ